MLAYLRRYLGPWEWRGSGKRTEDELWASEHLKQETWEQGCYQPRIFQRRNYQLYQVLLRGCLSQMRALEFPLRKPSLILGVVRAKSTLEWTVKVTGGKEGICYLQKKKKRPNCSGSYFNSTSDLLKNLESSVLIFEMWYKQPFFIAVTKTPNTWTMLKRMEASEV